MSSSTTVASGSSKGSAQFAAAERRRQHAQRPHIRRHAHIAYATFDPVGAAQHVHQLEPRRDVRRDKLRTVRRDPGTSAGRGGGRRLCSAAYRGQERVQLMVELAVDTAHGV